MTTDIHAPACPGPHRGAVAGKPVWCRAHQDAITDCLLSVPAWITWLADEHARRTNTPDAERAAPRGKAASRPSPSTAVDLEMELRAWVAAWAESMADYHRHAGPRMTGPTALPVMSDEALKAGLRYLLAQSRHWLHDPQAPLEIGLEALNLRDRMLDYTRRCTCDDGNPFVVCRRCDVTLPTPCPRCDRSEVLRRRNGDDRVACVACGRVWTEEEYTLRLRYELRVAQDRRSNEALIPAAATLREARDTPIR